MGMQNIFVRMEVTWSFIITVVLFKFILIFGG